MKKMIISLVACLVATAIVCAACESGKGKKKGKNEAAKKITLDYVVWSDAVASTNVMKVLLEDMGYEVKTVSVSAAFMWQSVATGGADAFVAAWLPNTHKPYHEKYKDDVVNLGPNLEGCRIGMVVPKYVTIDSISDLPENADKFDNRIIGIDPGAGIMKATERAIKEYRLENMQLIQGSGPAMAASLGSAIEDKEWIVVTGWTPHWKFMRWDLKYLKDPKNAYRKDEHVSTIVRKGLKEDMPKAYELLDNFYWEIKDVQELMMWNRKEDADPYKNAQKWVKQNPEMVKKWMP